MLQLRVFDKLKCAMAARVHARADPSTRRTSDDESCMITRSLQHDVDPP